MSNDLEIFFDAYIECACFTDDLPFLTNSELQDMKLDCIEFLAKAEHLLSGLDLAQCGHDFWLTRNGHGTGFWDRGYEESLGSLFERVFL